MTTTSFCSAPNVKRHLKPYVKKYDEYGELLNPITKHNPYFTYPRIHRRKQRNKVKSGQYEQLIPVFQDKTGALKKLSKIVWGVICGKPYAPNLVFVGYKRIIHDR